MYLIRIGTVRVENQRDSTVTQILRDIQRRMKLSQCGALRD